MSTAPIPAPPKRKRRWFQFSLRTLLLFVTVFAIWFGTLAKRANDQRNAVRELRTSGVEIIYEHQLRENALRDDAPIPGPEWLRRILGDDYFVTAVGGRFAYPEPNVNGLAAFPHVKVIVIDARCSDDVLGHVGEFNGLEMLFVRGPGVSDKGLAQLGSFRNLKTLVVYSDGRPTDSGVGALLRKSPNLNFVNIAGIDAAEDQLAKLREEFSRIPNLALKARPVIDN
jgi:hypothetical protein